MRKGDGHVYARPSLRGRYWRPLPVLHNIMSTNPWNGDAAIALSRIGLPRMLATPWTCNEGGQCPSTLRGQPCEEGTRQKAKVVARDRTSVPAAVSTLNRGVKRGSSISLGGPENAGSQCYGCSLISGAGCSSALAMRVPRTATM